MNKDDEFIDSLYNEADKQLNDTYKKKKESRDELLKAIAMILLTYTIVDNVLSLSEKDYNKEYSLLGALIVKLSKGNIRQEINNTTNILRNTVKNTYKHYSYNHNLKDVEKIINDNFKGKHFSDRVWENEQEVAKKLTQQCQDFLRGKINVNQIAKEIKDTYNTSAYNAKRLAETEVSRCHSAAFDRFCKETGVKKVKYNARKCNTCARCMDDDGKIFDLKNKPELPRHPMCKCYYDIVDDENKVNVNWRSNAELLDVQKQTGGKYVKGHIEWVDRRETEAKDYYDLIRNRSDDIKIISKNTGFSEKVISKIKNHIFYNDKHILFDGIRRLDPDYDMSVAWQRLINGNFEDRDILLLKHEYLESGLEKRYNLTNKQAHNIATKKYDWYGKLKFEKGEFGEDDCLTEIIRKK